MGAFLLRLCLCLGLLVNGSAQALAATHGALAHHHAGMDTAACDESGNEEVAKAPAHHATATASGMLDCCKSGVCDGVCSHGAFAVLPPVETSGTGIGPTSKLSLTSARYASPALPRLIRPPIL